MMDASRKKALVVNGSEPNRLLMSSYMYGAASAGSRRPAGSVLRSVGRVAVPALTLGVVSAVAVAIWAPGADERRDFFEGGREDASGQTGGAALREADARDGGSQGPTRSIGPGWSIASLLTNGDGVPANAGSKELPSSFKAGPQTARVSDPAPLVGIQAPASETRLEVAPSSDQGEQPLQESHLSISENAECLAPCDAIQGDLSASARAVAYSSEAFALDSASPPRPGLVVEVPQPQGADRAAGRFAASVNEAESQPSATDARLSEIVTRENLPLLADGEAPVVSAPSNAEPKFEGQPSPASPDESQRISQGSQMVLADAPASGTRPAVAEPRPGGIGEPSAKDTVTSGAQSFSTEPDRPVAAGRLVETVSVATAGQDGSLGVSSVEIAEGDLVSIKLGDLISLFEDRLDRPLFVWMSSSMAAEKYVTPETLAAAGLAVSFDPARGQVVLAVSD